MMMTNGEEEERRVPGAGPSAAGAAKGGSPGVLGGGGQERNSKRVRSDAAEWSETAINGLLEAFGARYIASHRGNLRGKDWEDVTRAVNASGVTGTKTVEQCRNKIDNLKKRFKLEREKGGSGASAWPWFQTLDAIVGRAPKRASFPVGHGGDSGHRSDHDVKLSFPGIVDLQPTPHLDQLASPPLPASGGTQDGGQDDSDPDNVAETPYSSQRDSHTDFFSFKGHGKDVMSEMTTNPSPDPEVNVVSTGPGKPNRKKRKNGCSCQAGKDVADSIASFAEVFAKIEFAKMELFKDVEMRRLEMQYKLAKLARSRKKCRTDSESSGSD